jgi:hypothetical protein
MSKAKPTDTAQPVMSITEFRKFAGKEAERFDDEEVTDLIGQLTLIADMFIKKTAQEYETGEIPTVPKST